MADGHGAGLRIVLAFATLVCGPLAFWVLHPRSRLRSGTPTGEVDPYRIGVAPHPIVEHGGRSRRIPKLAAPVLSLASAAPSYVAMLELIVAGTLTWSLGLVLVLCPLSLAGHVAATVFALMRRGTAAWKERLFVMIQSLVWALSVYTGLCAAAHV